MLTQEEIQEAKQNPWFVYDEFQIASSYYQNEYLGIEHPEGCFPLNDSGVHHKVGHKGDTPLYENSAEYGIKVSGFIGTQSDETWSSDVLFQFPGTGKFYAISVEGKVETFNSYYDRLYVEYTNRFKEGNFQRIKFPTITHRNLNGGGQIIVEDGEIESIGDEWADEYRLRDEADLGDYVETSIIRIFAPPPCPTFILLRFDTRDSKHQVGGRLRLTARIRTSFQGKWINPEDFYL